MRIVRIISGTSDLLSLFNEEQNLSEFDLLFDTWIENIEFLNSFFETHKKDLGNISISTAINRTIKDAEDLEDKFLDVAENKTEQLQSLFKPLSNSQYRLTDYQKSKVYGSINRSWLRVYAIRISPDIYIVTGGAIKLTQTMQDRPHTNEQLLRLNRTKDYLREIGFNNKDIENLEVQR